jgi:hypothetical protein
VWSGCISWQLAQKSDCELPQAAPLIISIKTNSNTKRASGRFELYIFLKFAICENPGSFESFEDFENLGNFGNPGSFGSFGNLIFGIFIV